MSTEILTLVVTVTLIAGLFTSSVMELYKRRLMKSALSASAMCAATHIAFIMVAWRAAAHGCFDSHRAIATMRLGELADWPPISLLPTAAYDFSAWASVIFFTLAIVLGAIEWKLRKAAEKEMADFLKDILFGVNEPEENKSEED